MASFSLFLLTVTVILKRFSPVDGHGLCVSNIHQELHSYYKTFMHLETIGVLQCIKECKKYRLCQKIHHDRVQLTCDLMMTYAEEGKVTSLLDVASVQMDNSKCLPNSCSETQVCVDMRDGGHTCLDQAVCPAPDWVLYSNKCYFFRQSRSDADESEGFCGGMNAKLVRIDNDGVKAFLKSEIDRRGLPNIWISANDRAVEGKWVWGPGDEVLDAAWGFGKPGGGPSCNCVKLLSAMTWNDVICSTDSSYTVCEIHYNIV